MAHQSPSLCRRESLLSLPPAAPKILASGSFFGVGTNGFGFNFIGYSNQVVVVEACTNLSASAWIPLQTNVFGTNTLYNL